MKKLFDWLSSHLPVYEREEVALIIAIIALIASIVMPLIR